MYARLLASVPFAILATILAAPVYAFGKLSDGVWWLAESIAGETGETV